MTPFSLPPDYARIKAVNSFHELLTIPFANGVNALCWQRTLVGDFREVVELLGTGEGITTPTTRRITRAERNHQARDVSMTKPNDE